MGQKHLIDIGLFYQKQRKRRFLKKVESLCPLKNLSADPSIHDLNNIGLIFYAKSYDLQGRRVRDDDRDSYQNRRNRNSSRDKKPAYMTKPVSRLRQISGVVVVFLLDLT